MSRTDAPLLETAIRDLGTLIGFPSVSRDGNLELIAWASARLGALGGRIRLVTDPSGAKASLFASFGPDAPGGIMLSGHTDVVPVDGQDWSVPPFEMTGHGGLLFGRGACDMKGFIACVMAALPGLVGRPLARPLHVALTHDEEVGCVGARQLAAEMRREGIVPDLAIIGEPTEMRIVEGHKGCCEYTTEFSGLAGHGSAPDRGVNAAEYAVRYAARLMALGEDLRARAPADSRFDPPWTTLSIGRISGGEAHNVIPETATLDWEMRPATPSDAVWLKREIDAFAEGALLPKMRAVHPGAAIARHVVGEAAALEPRPDNPARALVAGLTGANGADVVAFGTEAGIFQELGIACVVCGPGSIAQAHKADEFVAIDELARCLSMLEALGPHLSARG